MHRRASFPLSQCPPDQNFEDSEFKLNGLATLCDEPMIEISPCKIPILGVLE